MSSHEPIENKNINEAANETASLVLLHEFQVRNYLVQELRLHFSLVFILVSLGLSIHISDSVYMDHIYIELRVLPPAWPTCLATKYDVAS